MVGAIPGSSTLPIPESRMKLAPLVVVLLVLLVCGGTAFYLMMGPATPDGPLDPGLSSDGGDAGADPLGPQDGLARPLPVADGTSVRTLLAEDTDAQDLPPASMLTAAVHVRVEDAENGSPVVGAELALRSGGVHKGQKLPLPFGDYQAKAKSDADGQARLVVPPVGVYALLVKCPGYAARDLGPLMANDNITVKLLPGHVMNGRVFDQETGLALGEALVRVARGAAGIEVASEVDGSFAVPDLAAGTYAIEVMLRGYDIETRAGIQIGSSAAMRLEIGLTPGVLLAGTVTDEQSGAPIDGAKLVAAAHRSLDGELADYLKQETTSGADGSFTLEGVSRVEVDLMVEKPGYAPFRQKVHGDAAEKEWKIEVKLTRGTSVAGVVISPDGAPVPGAQVRLGGVSRYDVAERTVKADGAGGFTFKDVKPGVTFDIVAVSTDPLLAPGMLTDLSVAEGATLKDLTVQLAVGARVKGSVVDASNRPVPHARVSIDGLSNLMWRALGSGPFRYSDENGLFELVGMPEEPIVLAAAKDDILSPAINLPLIAGEEHEIRLRLIGGLTLAGLVTNSLGRPVDDVLVTAYAQAPDLSIPDGSLDSADPKRARSLIKGLIGKANAGDRVLDSVTGGKASSTAFRGLARTGEDGRFELVGLESAVLVALVFEHDDYASAYRFNIAPEAGELRVKLSPMVVLTGRVTDSSTRRPLEQFTVVATPSRVDEDVRTLDEVLAQRAGVQTSFHSADGTFSLSGLEAGRYDVTVRAEGYKKMKPEVAKLSESWPTRLDIELTPGAIVTGRVLAPDGSPVARMPVFLKKSANGSAFTTQQDDASRKGGNVARATDWKGEFRFTDVDAGTFELGLGKPAEPLFAPQQLEVAEGAQIDREIRLEGAGSLEVEVRAANGFGLPQADVTLRGQKSGVNIRRRTDESGRVGFGALFPEEYLLIVAHAAHKPHKQTLKVADRDDKQVQVNLVGK